MAILIKIASIAHFLEKPLTQNALYVRKTAIFIKIAPIAHFLEKTINAKCILPRKTAKSLKSLKMVNAQRVFLKENSHFLQDRPHLKTVNAKCILLKNG